MRQSCAVIESGDTEVASTNAGDVSAFDKILEEIGEFGFYQVTNGVLTSLALIFTSFALFNFVFSAGVPIHRCWIPECESIESTSFEPDWIRDAIPYKNGRPEACLRYEYKVLHANSIGDSRDFCDGRQFNRSSLVQCARTIQKEGEERLSTRLNMLCTEQESQLALIGTASTFGRFVAMPVAGLISDKLGRLITIIGCSLLGTVFSCLQSLPMPYMSFELYLALEFLAALSTAGILGTVFIYNMEWTTSKHCVLLNSLSAIPNSIGAALIGLAAWYYQDDFTKFKLVLAVPSVSIIFLYFILEESPRWLLACQKYEAAIKSIRNAGRINGHPPHERTIEHIQNCLTGALLQNTDSSTDDRVTIPNMLKHRILAFRLVILSFVWLFTLFAYYGVVLGSTDVHENKYFSFIIIGLAEIPGALATIFVLDRFGRRTTVGVTLLIYGFTIIAASIVPATESLYQLTLFFVGKASLASTLVGLYTYTVELWPTAVRNTAFSICSTAGRIGSILASLSVLLARYGAFWPTLLYGSVTISAAILVFVSLPETSKYAKLPDTFDEAITIGSTKSPLEAQQ